MLVRSDTESESVYTEPHSFHGRGYHVSVLPLETHASCRRAIESESNPNNHAGGPPMTDVTTAFTVRRATLGDLARLTSFAVAEAAEAEGRALEADTVRRGVAAGLNDSSVATYWVLESPAGDVVGSASVTREWSNFNAAYYWWVQSMFIKPDYRGRRLAGDLLEAIARDARSEGAVDLRLYVRDDNARAIRAYAETGSVDSRLRIMTKTLTG